MNGKNEKMNTELQKKWFVYLGDHHEGPFNADELNQKQKNGQISLQSYAWSEGMADWKPILEINELSSELKKIQSVAGISPAKEKSPEKKKDSGPEAKKRKLIRNILLVNAVIFIPFLTLIVLSNQGSEEMHANLRPTLNKMVNKLPFMSVFFNMIPHSGELSKDAKKDMETAILGEPSNGVKMAITLLNNDPSRPSLYLATNLPDRTKFDVYLIGNSETLLNRLQFQSQLNVTTFRGIGKSDVLLSENAQPLAKGEYLVWVAESQEQEEPVKVRLGELPASRPSGVMPAPVPNSSKFVISKTFFIGGAKDENYLTKLKAFHEKVKENAEKELVELKQYSDTLNLQFQTLTTDFAKILKAKKVSENHKNNWKTTSEQWLQINNQLEQTIQTWSKETLQNEFFYGSSFELLKSSYDSIKKLFQMENEYVEKQLEKSSFEIQYGKAMNDCKLSLNQVKMKIDAIMNAPKSANGLPKRVDL